MACGSAVESRRAVFCFTPVIPPFNRFFQSIRQSLRTITTVLVDAWARRLSSRRSHNGSPGNGMPRAASFLLLFSCLGCQGQLTPRGLDVALSKTTDAAT